MIDAILPLRSSSAPQRMRVVPSIVSQSSSSPDRKSTRFPSAPEIFRYNIETAYDRRDPAATIFIGSTADAGGAVNCFPKLIESETVRRTTQSCEVNSGEF